MASLLEEILGEKEGALPPEPVKPEKTGDFWTDLKNQYNYNDAMTRYNEQVGMSSQRPFSEHMKVAEFRPINAREKKLINLAKLLRSLKSTGSDLTPEAKETHRFIVRHLERMSGIDKKAKERGSDLETAIGEKIRKEFPPKQWTPQVEENLPPGSMNDIFPTGGPKWGKLAAKDESESVRNEVSRMLIDQNIGKIVSDDFASIGYPRELLDEANAASRSLTGEDRIGKWKWGTMNDIVTRTKPPHVYHKTTNEKLQSIAEKGLTPAEKLPVEEVNWPSFPEQQDKVFFGDRRETGVGINLPGSTTTLRTKFREDMNPDIHSPRGWRWYQTKNPVPPEALEIETAPGQWEALLDYIRKGGK